MTNNDIFLESVSELPIPENLVDRVEWCRKVVSLVGRYELKRTATTEWLIALDSETDEFPIGRSRSHWSNSALEREDKRLLALFYNDLEALPEKLVNLRKELKN